MNAFRRTAQAVVLGLARLFAIAAALGALRLARRGNISIALSIIEDSAMCRRLPRRLLVRLRAAVG